MSGPDTPKEKRPGDVAAERLWEALSFEPGNLWWGEWVAGVVGALAGGWLAVAHEDRVPDVAAVGAALVGVLVGAVIAGMGVQTAAFDRTFLQNLTEICRDPVSLISPFLQTAVIGIAALVGLLAWVAVPDSAPAAVRGLIGAFSGSASLWTLASLIGALGTLVQFIGLLQDSALVPELPEPPDGPQDANATQG